MTAHSEFGLKVRAMSAELRPTLKLALPIVLAELGWMGMGVVDTVMVGRLGPEAIGAVGLGTSLHMAVVVFGLGLLLGLDAVVSRSFGKGDLHECHRSMVQGIYLSLLATPLLMGVVWLAVWLLPRTGITPEVRELAGPFLNELNWSTPPLMLYGTLRRYVQAMGEVRAVMIALLVANLVNLLGNYTFIYGHFGMPALGVAGSGWSTCLARVGMAASLALYVVWMESKKHTGLWEISFRFDAKRLRHILTLGIPAAIHVGLEVGVFASVTALAGCFSAVALASHQLVLETASVTFMVPYGVSSAAAVRVGHALGRHEPKRAGSAGWAGIVIGEGFMMIAGLTFLLLPRTILGFYTNDTDTIAAGVGLLAIAACFQLFDGLQVVSTGVLRGAGDTHTTMYVNLVAYWVIGLPLAAFLAFRMGLGVPGLWIGLCVGLIAAGAFLLRAWAKRAQQLEVELAGSS